MDDKLVGFEGAHTWHGAAADLEVERTAGVDGMPLP